MPQLLKNPVINFILQFVYILLMIIITEMPSLLMSCSQTLLVINFQSYRKSIYPLILDFQIPVALISLFKNLFLVLV